MRRSYVKKSCFILFIVFISLNIFSCSSTKKIKYFQDIPDSGALKTISKANYIDLKIQIDDIVTVIVQTVDPVATQMINSGNVSVGTTSSSAPASPGVGLSTMSSSSSQSLVTGYLVDKDGDISIPVLGKIHAAGYTTAELKDAILAMATKYYQEPNVIVRFSNFKISVTGEVARPGVYMMPNERVSIFDAISLAGDLTIFGKRDNVLLLRENADGTKTPVRINLKKSDIMSSPYFYLRQNDVIYVQPDSGKAAATDASQAKYFTILGSLISVLIVFLSRR